MSMQSGLRLNAAAPYACRLTEVHRDVTYSAFTDWIDQATEEFAYFSAFICLVKSHQSHVRQSRTF
ncbi:MAG: hypothetical protein Q7T64_02120 [Lacisediminimonas sp.]|nr:hypothetical protein [Lacisediminimonas sp.]